jgi:hypothetical protein
MSRFIIISTGLWNLDYILANIESVNKQTASEWLHLLVIDNKAEEAPLVKEHQNRKYYIRKDLHYDLENTLWAIKENEKEIHDDDVICILNLDDTLLPNALESVKKIYEGNPQTLLTYGSYVHLSGRPGRFAAPYRVWESIRLIPWKGSHMRTFKAKLWRAIPDEELRDSTGRYYHVASDLATMFPMMEMAGLERCVYNSEVIYLYNDKTPLSEHLVYGKEQQTADARIRARSPLKRIRTL